MSSKVYFGVYTFYCGNYDGYGRRRRSPFCCTRKTKVYKVNDENIRPFLDELIEMLIDRNVISHEEYFDENVNESEFINIMKSEIKTLEDLKKIVSEKIDNCKDREWYFEIFELDLL